VRFRQVESLALSDLHEFGLAEPAARGAAERLGIGLIAMTQSQGRKLLGRKPLAGDRAGVRPDAIVPHRATTLTRTHRRIGRRAGAGTGIPICPQGFLCAAEPLIRRPTGPGGWLRPGGGRARSGGLPSDRADHTMLPASAPSHVDCF